LVLLAAELEKLCKRSLGVKVGLKIF